MLKRKWKTKKVLGYILTSFLLFVVAFIPFAGDNNLTLFIVERISATLGQYPYTSINAFNFWGLFGFWQKDVFAISFLGIIVTAITFLLGAKKLWKTRNSRYLLLAVIFATNFLFFTRMHERHLLPVFAPLAVSASLNSNFWLPYIGFSLVYIINLYYSFVWITQSFTSILPPFMIAVCILFNLGFFLLILFEIFKKRRYKHFFQFFKDLGKKLRPGPKALSQKTIKLSTKTVKISLLIIFVFALISRTLWLTSPSNEYFDEVYHAFTARRMLHGDPKAWEWWNTPPEGFAYEWTHPPLAKLGMILGMVVFGENSFGWRIPGALLGVGSVMLIYLIAKKLFKDELVGLLSASVFALEGLPLVMTRIGMNDSYFLFFSLLALYLLLVDKYLLSVVSFGLTASSKWSAVWLAPILLVAFFVLKKKFKPKYLLYVFIPPLVYLASYIPMFLTGHGFDIFIGVQKQMWWYHTRLDATHSYTSSWWTWPFLVRPIYLYTSNVVGGTVARIYAMGNPIIFWFGIFSVLLSAFFAFVERNKKLGFIVFSYFIFFAFWAVSPRIMFLYHYLPSLPFMAIAVGFILRRFPRIIIPFLAVSLVIYLFFFPHLVGLQVPVWLDKLYYWLPSWR
jgi:4-amino-4-deoxy-L-arabinose transferase-like glycosyltransferase